ncbi:MAG: hypothetical protein VX777_01705 [Chlamydiota bacterium]|nr:hypothetical protein [Chlamydiota bacterium]
MKVAESYNLTRIEQVTLRPYYLLVAGIDLAQMVAKIAALTFASMITGMYFGTSKTMNRWCVVQAKDVWISMKMVAFAVVGVFKPILATNKRVELTVQGAHGLCKFDYTLIKNSKKYEKIGMSLQFIVNTIKEMFSVCASGIRYAGTLLIKAARIESLQFERVNDHEFFLLCDHKTFAFESAEGVFYPKKKHYLMTTPS